MQKNNNKTIKKSSHLQSGVLNSLTQPDTEYEIASSPNLCSMHTNFDKKNLPPIERSLLETSINEQMLKTDYKTTPKLSKVESLKNHNKLDAEFNNLRPMKKV